MRKLLLAALLVSAAAPASAASIQEIHAAVTTEGSILTISCPGCVARPAQDLRKYTVPTLSEGVASMDIVDKDGKPEVRRVDKFLGGSPVVTISQTQAPLIEQIRDANHKLAEARIAARNAELAALEDRFSTMLPPDARPSTAFAGIDRNSTTAAVSSQADAAPFDPSTLKLRLN